MFGGVDFYSYFCTNQRFSIMKTRKCFFYSLLAILLMGVMAGLSACGDDSEDAPAPEPVTVHQPKDDQEARAMLTRQPWRITMESLAVWNEVQGIDIYKSAAADIDDAVFVMMTDHCLVAVHIKGDAAILTEKRGKWGIAKLFDSWDYNIQPLESHPTEGTIYDDELLQTLSFRLLNSNSMELLVGKGSVIQPLLLTPVEETITIDENFLTL